MNTTAALKHFEDNPRATAREAGLTNAEANELVGQGRIVAVGNRVTGKRGRPPMEYVVAGAELDHTDDAYVQKQVAEATERVWNNRRYERMWSKVMSAYHDFGYGSEEHTAAKLDLYELFPKGTVPATPSKNDYVLAGELVEDNTPLDVPELEEVA